MTEQPSNLPATIEGHSAAAAIKAALERMEVRKQFVHAAKETGLQKDVDYGLIPGCGDKPALLKSGAEALAQSVTKEAESLFLGCGRFGSPRIERAVEIEGSPDWPLGLYSYRVSVDLIGPSGAVLGTGVGLCSSQEKKYRERKGQPTPAADSANTVLKMAVKRAKVDAAIGVFGASSMFTQDVEDSAPTDPLNAAIGFGKHAEKTWREAASDGLPTERDSGASWLHWYAHKSDKARPADRALALRALDEAAEMRVAASEAPANGAHPYAQPPSNVPLSVDDFPEIGGPPAPLSVPPGGRPASVTASVPAPATPTPPALDAHLASIPATPLQFDRLSAAFDRAAKEVGCEKPGDARRKFTNYVWDSVNVICGVEAHKCVRDPKAPRPTAAKMEEAIEAVAKAPATWRVTRLPVAPGVASAAAERTVLLQEHQDMLGLLYGNEGTRAAEYGTLCAQAIGAKEVSGPQALKVDALKAVSAELDRRLKARDAAKAGAV